MNPQLNYQAGMARIDDFHREAAKRSLGALAVGGRRGGWLHRLHLPRVSFKVPARERVA